jgi:hypothetical protein
MDDAFKLRARKHQSDYRAKTLQLPRYDEHESVLSEEDARNGQNFHSGYGVFEAVKKRSYTKNLYANMLRSEHIPFNIFVPFRDERALFCSVLASITGFHPTPGFDIRIEHPLPYLNDRTSFDVFCDCRDALANRFFIAIEVKYTEHGHSIGESERRRLLGYEAKSNDLRLYSPGVVESGKLRSNKLRQIWRNHLLAESLYQDKEKKYSDYRSIVLFPEENEYMAEAVADYEERLSPYGKKFFLGVTYEKLFDAIQEHASSSRANDWLAYLRRRYIPPINSSV